MKLLKLHKLRSKHIIFIIGIILVCLIGLCIVLLLIKKPTNNQSHATKATTLSLNPSTTTSTLNQSLPITVTINPGTNAITTLTLDIKYDATKFSPPTPAANVFAANTNAFPTTLQAPTIVAPGELQVSLGIGSTFVNAITAPTTVGTITLIPIAVSASASNITWGTATSVYSNAPGDTASENVLATTNGTAIVINPNVTNTPIPPTPTPTRIPTPTSTPLPTPTVTPQPTATPTSKPTSTPVPTATPTITSTPTRIPTLTSTLTPTPTSIPTNRFAVTLFLHDIGNAGDVLQEGTQGNMSPVRTTYPLTIELDDINNNPITTATGLVTWNPTAGDFTNSSFDFDKLISTGSTYNALVIIPGFLHKKVSQGPFAIQSGGTNTFQTLYLTNGDINGDNVFDLLDYNILLSCYSDFLPAQPACTSQLKSAADLNDDGAVNNIDYNAWIRESSKFFGD